MPFGTHLLFCFFSQLQRLPGLFLRLGLTSQLGQRKFCPCFYLPLMQAQHFLPVCWLWCTCQTLSKINPLILCLGSRDSARCFTLKSFQQLSGKSPFCSWKALNICRKWSVTFQQRRRDTRNKQCQRQTGTVSEKQNLFKELQKEFELKMNIRPIERLNSSSVYVFYSALLSTTKMCFCVSEIPKHHFGQQMQIIPEPSWIPGWVPAAESLLSNSELLEATTFSWGVLWYYLPVDTRSMCRPPQVTYKASFCHRLQWHNDFSSQVCHQCPVFSPCTMLHFFISWHTLFL